MNPKDKVMARRDADPGPGAIVVLLAALLLLHTAATHAAESGEFTINTRGGTPGGTAAYSSDFAINTRGGAAGYANSAYITIDTRDGSSLSVPVKAVDGLGAHLAGVTVTVRQNGFTVATATTAGNGTATLAGLLAGYYELRTEKAGYLTQARLHQRVPEDVLPALAFVLTAPPGVPVLHPSGSVPPASLLNKPVPAAIGNLKVFQGGDSGQFVNINRTTNPLDPRRMTIVMTHGADSSSGAWPLDLARKLTAVPGLAAKANILAWDWEVGAAVGTAGIVASLGLALDIPRQQTPEQGLALGQTLWNELGGDYAKPVHFLGHSLGTLVNCAAANYLHSDWGDDKTRVPQAWSPTRTHMTLFDHAGLLPDFRHDPNPVSWALPIPVQAAFVDSYLTMVGVYLDTGINVFLQRSEYLLPNKLHAYPCEWYGETITNPTGSDLGFRYSFEQAELAVPPAPFSSPIPTLYRDGAIFAQDEGSADKLALVNLDVPEGLAARVAIELVTRFPAGGAALNYSLQATRAGVQATTFVVNAVTTAAAAAARKIGRVFVSVGETFLDNHGGTFYGGTLNPIADPVYGVGATTPAVLGIPGYRNDLQLQPNWGLRADLFTLPPPTVLGPQSQSVRPSATRPTNTPAYVWLPVQVPSNAVSLVFDFTVNGDGASDRVVAGINDTNLFSLATQFITTNTVMTSGALFVDRWAGQDVELFFGIAGGTSTNAAVSVQNIRFLGLPLPVLVAENVGPDRVLSWTESAPGFVLEFSTNLTDAGPWSAQTNVGGYVGQRVFTNQTTGFYRLRRP